MGGGEEISFWRDKLVGAPLKRRFERLYLLSTNKEASLADMRRESEGNGGWDFQWRRELFEWESELLQVMVLKSGQ
jgi:hypothetical protein